MKKKFLIYHSAEHLTPYGVMMEGLINGSFGHNYIMDLSTGKSTRFIDEIVAFKGLDSHELTNFYLVSNYVRCLKKYNKLNEVLNHV